MERHYRTELSLGGVQVIERSDTEGSLKGYGSTATNAPNADKLQSHPIKSPAKVAVEMLDPGNK